MTIRDLKISDWFVYFASKDVLSKDEYCLLIEHHQELAELIMFDNKGKCLGLRRLREVTEVEYLGNNIKDLVWS